MGNLRFHSAVLPFHRDLTAAHGHDLAMPASAVLPTVAQMVATLRPAEPVHCLRPLVLTRNAARFVTAFPGTVLYAVKCNPEPEVLRALHAGGVRHFDVASPAEIGLVRRLFPEAELHYMHPVKSRAAIRTAHGRYGVRDFALDSLEELDKLRAETGYASDLGLFVRLAVPKGNVVHDLSGKFGAAPDEAVRLLRAARSVAGRVGLCFHVGSQCIDPAAYERALAVVGTVVAAAGVPLDVLDLGGGFPVSYPGVTPPPFGDFLDAIARGVARLDLPPDCALWCEPGRALAAPGVSLVLQVLRRRGRELYVNDGVYGSLSDAGVPGFRFPARLIRPAGPSSAPEVPFALFGPTCDSADRMVGPFLLPDDTAEGDWIELGQLGAYGACLRTAFNGFDQTHTIAVCDPPLLETPGYRPLRRVA